MSYVIKVDYETGDSFGTEDTYCYIEYYDEKVKKYITLEWENVEIAKENLERIKQHYEWINSYGRWRDEEDHLETPDFVKKHFKNPYSKNKRYVNIDFEAELYLYLKLDDESEVKITCHWNGYFETLYGAQIESKKNDGWSFSV